MIWSSEPLLNKVCSCLPALDVELLACVLPCQCDHLRPKMLQMLTHRFQGSALGSGWSDLKDAIDNTDEDLIFLFCKRIKLSENYARSVALGSSRQGQNYEYPLACMGLHYASQHGKVSAAQMLLATQADINSYGYFGNLVPVSNRADYTALHHASHYGCTRTTELLLRSRANLEPSGLYFDVKPLHVAALRGHPEVVESLLTAKSNANTILTDYGECSTYSGASALALVLHKQTHSESRHRIVELLLEAAADPNHCGIDIREPPLSIALKGGSSQMVQTLLTASADVHKDLPLVIAHGSEDILKLIDVKHKTAEHKCEPWNSAWCHKQSQNPGGSQTPLHIAVEVRRMEAIRLFMGKGAMVNAQSQNCWTPIDIAARCKEHGHSFGLADLSWGMDIPVACSDAEIVDLLVSHGAVKGNPRVWHPPSMKGRGKGNSKGKRRTR